MTDRDMTNQRSWKSRALTCFMTLAMVVAAGCGDDTDETAADPTTTSPSPASSEQSAEPRPQDEGNAEGEGADETGTGEQAGDDAAPASANGERESASEAPEREGEALRRHVRAENARIRQLKRFGHIAEALRAAQQLAQRYPRFQRELELTYQVRRLLQRRREAAPLKFALDKFTEYSSTQLDAAYTRFRRAGETGAFVLGRAVAERPDDIAGNALTMLIDLDAAKVADACARRLQSNPDRALRSRCLDLIAERPETLTIDGIAALYRAAVDQKDRPDGVRLRRLTALRLEVGIDNEAMEATTLRALDAAGGETQDAELVDLIGAIYHFGAGRSDEAFAAMAGEAARLDAMRSAAEGSAGSSGESGAGPTKAERLLTPVDLAGLEEGLAARWTFGTTKWPVLPGDVQREVEGEAVAVGRERSSGIVSASYSIAAWVRPKALPLGNADQPFFVLARKAGWPMALMVAPDGAVVFMHALEGVEEPIVCRSSTKLAPGVWTHVAAAVGRDGGRVVLTIDGAREGAASFEAGAKVATNEDATRPYRVLDIEPPDGESAETKFTGEVEALRLYERSLEASVARDLSLVGHVWE